MTNHELQRNFFASLEIPNLGRYVEIKNDNSYHIKSEIDAN